MLNAISIGVLSMCSYSILFYSHIFLRVHSLWVLTLWLDSSPFQLSPFERCSFKSWVALNKSMASVAGVTGWPRCIRTCGRSLIHRRSCRRSRCKRASMQVSLAWSLAAQSAASACCRWVLLRLDVRCLSILHNYMNVIWNMHAELEHD